ncbi:MAG: hypothetical protein ACTFAK_02800 [Candidatus Electronema sp. VV]
MNRFFNAVIYSAVVICSFFQASEGFTQNTDGFNDEARVKTAIDLIKIACATGETLDIEITGDGGLSFLKKGVSGAAKFSKEEINGVVKGTNQMIASEDNENIRKCMQQYVPKILDKLLETRTASSLGKDKNFYIADQKIPVGSPMSILDGKVWITINKISEHIVSRNKTVELSIETPKRNPYNITLISDKSSSQFTYRDIVYKITAVHIALEDQYAIVSIVKSKNVD